MLQMYVTKLTKYDREKVFYEKIGADCSTPQCYN